MHLMQFIMIFMICFCIFFIVYLVLSLRFFFLLDFLFVLQYIRSRTPSINGSLYSSSRKVCFYDFTDMILFYNFYFFMLSPPELGLRLLIPLHSQK